MAFVNINKPAGLSPVKTLSGSDWTGKAGLYCIPASDATYNYFVGDPVGFGTAGAATFGTDALGTPFVTLPTNSAGAVPSIVGSIIAMGPAVAPLGSQIGGPYINPNDLTKTFRPKAAGINWYCLVADDPNLIFEIQESSGATALTAGLTTWNFDLLQPAASTAAAPTNTLSQYLIDLTRTANTVAYQLKLLRLAPRPDNHYVAGTGTFQKWWVIINNHQYRTGIVQV